MSDIQADADFLRITIHNDDETPVAFVVDLLQSVFEKSATETTRFLEKIEKYGQAGCGTYPRERARRLLAAARRRIKAAGHPLSIATEAVADDDEDVDCCKLCGTLFDDDRQVSEGMLELICDDCLYEISRTLPEKAATKPFEDTCEALAWHFAGIPLDQLVATSRQFPGHMRADVQGAIDRLFSASPLRFFGIHEPHRYDTLSIASLLRPAGMPTPSRRRNITTSMSARARR